MSQGIHLRKFGVEATIDFEVYEVDGVDLRTDWVPAVADCEIMKDGGTSTQCTNTAVDEGSTYSIVLTATEMQAARLVLKVVDAATKVFLDKIIIIETYGNASAQHAVDFDDAVRAGLSALPNAAAEAAGGLYTRGTGAGQINQDTNGRSDSRVVNLSTAVITSGAFNLGAVDAAAIATDAIGASELATSAVQEIRDAITGGAFALDTDANGRIRIVDGTGVGELNTDAGTVFLSDAATSAQLIDDVWDEVNIGATHNINNSTGKQLRQAVGLILNEGTLQSATADTAVIDAGASALDDFFNNNELIITGGTGAGQARVIPDYDGTSKTCTITPAWVTTPDATSAYEIIPASMHAATQNGGYEDARVFVDTVNGTAGTLLFVDGTSTRPVNNIADARTIADALNLKQFFLFSGSDVTLGQAFDGFLFEGPGALVQLGGRSVSGSIFRLVNVSGIGTGANATVFVRVKFTGPTQIENPTFFECDLFSNITFTGANFISLTECVNSSGTTTILDFGAAVGNTNLNMVVNGDFEIHNMGQTGVDTLEYIGVGILVFNANNVGGTATILDNPELTDNSVGLTIVNRSAALKLDDIQGVGFVTATDSLRAIQVDGVDLTSIEGVSTIDGESIIGTYRIFGAVLAGKSSSGGAIFRSMDDLKTRVTSTVDGSSNRTSVTLDGT